MAISEAATVARGVDNSKHRTGDAKRRKRTPWATVGLSIFCILFAYPMVWMVLGSLKTPQTFFSNLWGLPETWQFSNYADAWQTGKIGGYLLNSIVVSASTVALVVACALPLSYCLARVKFRGSRSCWGYSPSRSSCRCSC